ncbi:MAG TPA: hypothetical protein VHO06_17175 [Polyangia bacterium]|nr:hypothetical protein [Polyangia bacterium]
MGARYERNPGRIVELAVGSSQDVLDLQWKDEIAHVICVTLIGPPAVSGGAANAVSCVAFVQWGAGEAEAEAEIDFGIGGVVFTVPASSIRITAEYEGNFADTESPQPIRVGAFASVGSGARHTKLTRTRFVGDSIPPAGTTTFEVPPFAKALRVLGGDESSRSLQLDFFSDLAAPTPLYSVEVAAGAPSPLIDLAPDITSVVLTNTGGSALSAGVRGVFELGI